MKGKVLIVQRFYYSFREGFFEYLKDINFDFRLINATTSRGKAKVHEGAENLPYIEKTSYFFLGTKYVVFPFLFIRLIMLNPSKIVTEGGANTINNVQIFLYSKLFRCKYIIWDLGKGFADFGNSLFRRLYMRFYNYLLKHAEYIYVYNNLSRAYFKAQGISDNKIVVLNNTIDTRKIKRIRSSYIPEVPEALADQTGQDFTFLIFVGALVRSKNIEELAELMKMLGNKYYLVIVGDGAPEYKSELEKLFKGTNHFFAGYKKIEQLMPYYDLASFSVLPGLGGLSINQSMAFGVPVICKSADGAEKDLVVPDMTGYIYKDLSDACHYILSKTSDDWKKMGQNAEAVINTSHSVESMMNKFISCL
jgi:glycosyltransferase involved in cell wall biosynthesis